MALPSPVFFRPSPTFFRNVSVSAIALVGTISAFGAALAPISAQAKAKPVHYIAELAAPTAKSRIISRGVVWACKEDRCVAAQDNSRASIVCKRLVNEVGQVTSFTVKDVPFSAEELAACNG